MESRYEFDEVTVFSAHAMGVPGKRTFFVALGDKDRWVRIWLEKTDLQAFALSVNQLLLKVSRGQPLASSGTGLALSGADPASGLPAAELEADEITLGYEDGKASMNVGAHAVGPQRQSRIELECRPGLAQLSVFAGHSLDVCAAGRPLCVLCGGPMDPGGHICPRNN